MNKTVWQGQVPKPESQMPFREAWLGHVCPLPGSSRPGTQQVLISVPSCFDMMWQKGLGQLGQGGGEAF